MKQFIAITSLALAATSASAGAIIRSRAEDNTIPPPPSATVPTVSGSQDKIQLQPVIAAGKVESLEVALKPKTDHMVFLTSGDAASAQGQVAIDAGMHMSMQRPAVNFGASHDVVDVLCKDQSEGKATAQGGTETMTVKFKDNTARDGAMKLWQESYKSGLYFIDAYGKGCGKADEIQVIAQAPGTAVEQTEGGLVFQVYDVQGEAAVAKVQSEAVVDMRVAWGKDHKEAAQKADASNPTARRLRKRTPEADKFDGDWPTAGVYPTYAGKSQAQKRGVEVGWGWISASLERSADIDFPNNLLGAKVLKRKSPWYSPDGSTQLDGFKLNLDGQSEGVWCVDCQLKGKFATSGCVGWSFGKGAYATAFIGIQDTRAAAHLGLSYEKPVEAAKDIIEQIYTIPVSPFSLGSLLVVGPAVRIAPFVKMVMKTTGRILIGGELTWNKAEARYDSTNGKGVEKTGSWAPETQARLDLDAELNGQAQAGLRLSLDFGITSSLWKDTVGISLVEEPYFFAEAKAGVGASITKDKSGKWSTTIDAKTVEGCNGIQTAVGFQNRLYTKIGLAVKTFEWELIDPEIMKKEFASKCWKYEEILTALNGGAMQCMKSETCAAGL